MNLALFGKQSGRCAVLLAATSLIVLPAHAEDEPTVVVTVSRFAESDPSQPVNLTVIPRSVIEASAARSVPELLASQPGFAVHDFFGNGSAATSVDLRGFGATAGRNALVLVDGRRLSDIDLSDVQWPAIALSRLQCRTRQAPHLLHAHARRQFAKHQRLVDQPRGLRKTADYCGRQQRQRRLVRHAAHAPPAPVPILDGSAPTRPLNLSAALSIESAKLNLMLLTPGTGQPG